MFILSIIFYLGCATLCQCQHYSQGVLGGHLQQQRAIEPQSDPYNNYNRAPPPQILSHKQALNHDGNFKYLFTSENGLAQGESIAPDGSRNGGYSYVDPTGRKISVKYTAGKEGFKILEADHLPKAPLPVAPLPVPQQQQIGPQAYGIQRHDDGQYRPELYERPSPQQYYNTGALPQQQLQHQPQQSQNSIDDSLQINDAPGKPYSFGNGYIFEFGG